MKQSKGITLLALVITIVVLLILAGVTLNVVLDPTNVIEKAEEAKKQTNIETIKEGIQYSIMSAKIRNNEYKLEINILEEELKNNLGQNIGIEKIGTENGLPWIVIVRGYSFTIDENENIEVSGPKPQIIEVEIVTIDGEEIPTDGVDKGVQLKISFTTNIEGGVISKVTPGTLENDKVTYITTGTEKVVMFRITGKIGNNTYETTYQISLEDKYKIDHSEVKVKQIEKTGVFYNNDKIFEVREGNIPIPAGFKYIKGDEIGGAVITDAESGVEGEGNEFVWIPVYNINNMSQCEKAGGKCLLEVGENGSLICTVHDNSNIVGKIYATDVGNNSNFGTLNTVYDFYGGSSGTYKGLREPAIIRGPESLQKYDKNYASDAGFNTYSEMIDFLKSEYIRMAFSVKKYGGFYVGRYETSLDTNNKAKSIQGIETASSETSGGMWYGLYKIQSDYEKDSVQGSMIWGSQYDAIMNWMKENKINIESVTPTDLSIGITNRNRSNISGNEVKDKLSNIYDLLGNRSEWTLTGAGNMARIYRGGSRWYAAESPTKYYHQNPDNVTSIANIGSRMSIYIK